MDNAAPALEVGFDINTSASHLALDRLETAMGAAEASVVADAKRIEQATGNMVNLTGATAQITGFGNAGSRALKDLQRETAQAERSGEGLARSLAKQSQEFGKSRSEIRNMNAELRAVAAESKGLTELATRIRSLNAELNRLEDTSNGVGRATNKAGQGLRIVAMQMPDVIQGLLTAQPPMQILIQQGGQMYQAGQAAGIGLRAMAASVGALILPFTPLIAVLGLATAGFGLFVREMNRGVSNSELTRGLGKTAEQAEIAERQLKKLKEETITWGDTASALFTVVGKDIKDGFVSDMKSMSSDVKSVLDDLTTYGRIALAGLYAGAVGTKQYLGELSKPGAITGLLLGGDGQALLKRSYGAAFDTANNYLKALGGRVREEAKKNARIRIGNEYGLPDAAKRDRHAEALAREAEATERQIANLYKLADAYGVSSAAALIAEARVKAESAAIKKQADIDAMVSRQVRLAIAERVSTSAKSAAAKVGEGAFETLVRVASTVEAVTVSLDQLGLSTRALGLDAKIGIADQFDSVSAMTSAADSYFRAFYTPAEQNAARMAQLNGVFVRLGVTMPATTAAFRALVEAQDLTTAAGQSTYATLLQLAPAFAELKSAMDNAKSAADVLAEREGLQRRLLELEGNTAAIRALDLAKLDASNRALQQQIYAIEDAKEAARAADELRQAWSSVGDSIADEVKRIRGLDTVGGGGFAALLGQFNAATASARGGDIDAAKSLPGLSQALLKAAAEQATSRQELARIQAQTAASLEATQAAVAGRSTPSQAAMTAAILSNSAAVATVNQTSGNDDAGSAAAQIDALQQEIANMRADMAAALAAIASNTGKAARVLEDVTAQSGGDAITIASAAA